MRCHKSFTQTNTIFATLDNGCFNSPLGCSFAEYQMTEKKGMFMRCSAYSLESGAGIVQVLDVPLV
jgi:hypothetical protein